MVGPNAMTVLEEAPDTRKLALQGCSCYTCNFEYTNDDLKSVRQVYGGRAELDAAAGIRAGAYSSMSLFHCDTSDAYNY